MSFPAQERKYMEHRVIFPRNDLPKPSDKSLCEKADADHHLWRGLEWGWCLDSHWITCTEYASVWLDAFCPCGFVRVR